MEYIDIDEYFQNTPPNVVKDEYEDFVIQYLSIFGIPSLEEDAYDEEDETLEPGHGDHPLQETPALLRSQVCAVQVQESTSGTWVSEDGNAQDGFRSS